MKYSLSWFISVVFIIINQFSLFMSSGDGSGDDDQIIRSQSHTELTAMTQYRWEEQQQQMCLFISLITIPV